MMSDALHVPANPRTSHTATEMTECPVCHVALNKKNLSKHVRKVHGSGVAPAGKKSLEAAFDASKRKEFARTQGAARKGKIIGWTPGGDTGKKEKIKVNKKYYKCWQCGKLLTKASTANHLLKIHGVKPKDPLTAHFWYFDEVIKVQYRDKPALPKLGKKVESRNEVDWQKEIVRMSKAKLPDGSPAMIMCPACEVILSSKNVKKHFNKVHKELLKAPQRFKQESAPDDSKVSAKRKSLEVRPEYEYSEDVFDRAKVYQGGAYGLGKSRKH
jgi:uncharacterized C2H2 Zn-finger protein